MVVAMPMMVTMPIMVAMPMVVIAVLRIDMRMENPVMASTHQHQQYDTEYTHKQSF
jgi:hypothetical protein